MPPTLPTNERNNQQIQQPLQTFDQFLDRFNDLFRRTISEQNKEEQDFAPEYA